MKRPLWVWLGVLAILPLAVTFGHPHSDADCQPNVLIGFEKQFEEVVCYYSDADDRLVEAARLDLTEILDLSDLYTFWAPETRWTARVGWAEGGADAGVSRRLSPRWGVYSGVRWLSSPAAALKWPTQAQNDSGQQELFYFHEQKWRLAAGVEFHF